MFLGGAVLLVAAWSAVAPPVAAAPAGEVRLEGYAEWVSGRTMVVDGQRVRLAPDGRFRGHGARSMQEVPPGYEVRVRGRRSADGWVVAEEIEAEPNGSALFEGRVLALTDEAEAGYRRAGAYFQETSDGRRQTVGRLRESGPQVERVRAVVDRLRPPYVEPGRVRAYVIENDEWNAFAMGNYSIYVFDGLLRDLDDDELAIVLGHELAHATHEHTRRQFKKQMWVQIAALGAAVAAGEIDDRNKRAFARILAAFTVLAWTNGYGRDLEDQADRVGLRYAYEGGYDVSRGPHLWTRFARKYGEPGRVANFFFANHSRSSARAANLGREIALNYPAEATGIRTAGAASPARGGEARSSAAGAPRKETAALVAPSRGPGAARGVEVGMSPDEVRAGTGSRLRTAYPLDVPGRRRRVRGRQGGGGPVLILVSNDDGILSDGVKALADAMDGLDDEVWVVAPEVEQSATSHAISIHRPLRIRQVRERWYAVDGTPTDCSYIAINHILKGHRPRLMVSGINHGPNLADDVTYSGTVAAAMEASILGVPAIAFSLVTRERFDFGPSARFARALVRAALGQELPARMLLNVNVPGGGEPRGYEVTRLGKHSYGYNVVEKVDPRGRKYYWIGGNEYQHEDIPGSDCNAVLRDRLVSVTPLQLDLTDDALRQAVAAWPVQGFPQVGPGGSERSVP